MLRKCHTDHQKISRPMSVRLSQKEHGRRAIRTIVEKCDSARWA